MRSDAELLELFVTMRKEAFAALGGPITSALTKAAASRRDEAARTTSPMPVEDKR